MQMEAYKQLSQRAPADSDRIMPVQLGFSIKESDALDINRINEAIV